MYYHIELVNCYETSLHSSLPPHTHKIQSCCPSKSLSVVMNEELSIYFLISISNLFLLCTNSLMVITESVLH